ncbi:hypothetical protein [Meiothermus sp.]|uniref:hypothetical protein n=1 Tax=Meiothermus sp. TaxID=1955249 RepID=UPI0021DCDECF|nr:hypothetical protein [Meiothermus sp.]GIW33338.1 MAG: hypothetical protein KatS3mg072_0671 [Meiothermus sp.]
MIGIPEIKQGIVLVWAVWLSMVTLMNILEAFKALGLVPQNWKTSSNWTLMLRTTGIYHPPVWLVALLFGGVIVWEAVASGLLWWAFVTGSLEVATAAFGWCILLWGGFILANQFFMAWLTDPNLVAAHRSLFGVFVISLMAIRLL